MPAIFDRRGRVVYSEQLLDQRAAQGNEVTLTIDKTIQHVAERELELAVRTSEAHSGSLVALDPSTGELLAIANYPTYNPNEPGKSPALARRNRAITDRFEPARRQTVHVVEPRGGANSPTLPIDCDTARCASTRTSSATRIACRS